MTDDLVAVLVKAKERVAEGWWDGGAASCLEKCAAQAIYHQDPLWYRGMTPVKAALEVLAGIVVPDYHSRFITADPVVAIAWWNDAAGRTQADVLDAFDAAIRRAKEA